MADFVYLLETRLSAPQQAALASVRDVARNAGLMVFLVGGAVRDLVSGSPVRDLDIAIQGNALKLRKELERAGAAYSGESTGQQSLYVRFPGGIRVEVGSTLSVTYPKPGKPVYKPTTILEDLRRRDFTANAMALSLNDGSFGLLMDPLNGVADIENREMRLVSNYGFIEDPVRLIRAARFMARLGWQMEERTRSRYQTAKEEGYIAALGTAERAYELEELFHEEDALRVMRRLEEEGWLTTLSPALGVAKANVAELTRLRESQMQLETRGIRADASAANFALLLAKVPAKEIEALKETFPRATFAEEIDTLEAAAKELGSQLLSKTYAAPSEAYKLILQASPVTVLWAMHSSRSAALQARFKSFLSEWPQAQGRIPYLLLTEMRITPELPEYSEMIDRLVYALMDGQLNTPEEMRAFLEPYSPPAPPPPVSLRRARAPRKEAKAAKSRKKLAAPTDETAMGDGGQPTGAPEVATPGIAVMTETAAPAPLDKKDTSKKEVAKKETVKKSEAKHTAALAPAQLEEENKLAIAPGAKRPVKLAAAAAPAKVRRSASATAAKKPAPKAGKAPARSASSSAGRSAGKAVASKKASIPPTRKGAAPARKIAPAKKAAPVKPAKKVAAKGGKKVVARAAPSRSAPAKRSATKPATGRSTAKPALLKMASAAKNAVPSRKAATARKAPAKKLAGKRR